MAVIDTAKLAEEHQIFHVPYFGELVPSSGDVEYGHEYLSHGIVRGEGLHTIETVKDEYDDRIWRPKEAAKRGPSLVTIEDLAAAKSFAAKFGPEHDDEKELYIFLIVAFLSMRYRWRERWCKEDVDTICNQLQEDGHSIPGSFAREDWIMLDFVDGGTDSTPHGIVLLLRALTYKQFGLKDIVQRRIVSPALKTPEPNPEFLPFETARAGYKYREEDDDKVAEKVDPERWRNDAGKDDSGQWD